MQLSAKVAVTAGPGSNGIGLGCVNSSQSKSLAFFVHDTGLWQVLLFSTGNSAVIVDSGISSAIHESGPNSLTIACNDQPSKPGSSQIAFEINGTPVASDIVNVGASTWAPTIQLCSCDGVDTGRFLDAAYYASATASSAASGSQVSAALPPASSSTESTKAEPVLPALDIRPFDQSA
jgi:hypothetical protein